ncbi:MAG TPA: tRNA (guanosine(37)-N1)-methyltransferase TrmD, partial [Candidatus Paceibacterota bacterium]|nr:tRNA (guanosine(37)-N1)-methyltransferase TrmD [Candidatus Paceibacterota bacterium]
MNFHIISIFPDLVASYLSESILARAIREKKIKVSFYNPRDFAKASPAQKGKEKPYLRVDDKPYGGGPGMVMEALPVLKAVEKAKSKIKKGKAKVIFFAPNGKKFDTQYAKNASKKYTDIILICGRYEG